MFDVVFLDFKWYYVGFSVNSLDIVIWFYQDVFGMVLECKMEIFVIGIKIVFLWWDNFWFELFEKEGFKFIFDYLYVFNIDLMVQGIKYVCFLVENCQDVLECLFVWFDVEVVGII